MISQKDYNELFRKYLNKSISGIDSEFSKRIRDVWESVLSIAGDRISWPVIEVNDNKFKYIWNYLPIYLEIELNKDSLFWFVKDRSLNETDSGHDFEGLRLWVVRITLYADAYACERIEQEDVN